MSLTRLSSADGKKAAMDGLVGIYTEAIAPSEQKSRQALEAMLLDASYYFYLLYIKEQPIGFAIVYSPEHLEYCLLEYMAVSLSCRNEGYGGKIFDELTSLFKDKCMVIEIDSPEQKSEDQEIRKRRMAFYQRHGSVCVSHLRYTLPLEVNGTPPDMLLMLHAKKHTNSIKKAVLKPWVTDIYTSVYGCRANDPRLERMFTNLPNNLALTK
jgi:hypothetical protein